MLSPRSTGPRYPLHFTFSVNCAPFSFTSSLFILNSTPIRYLILFHKSTTDWFFGCSLRTVIMDGLGLGSELLFIVFLVFSATNSVASVCRLPSLCTECIVAKRCILEQKLLLRAHRKSYMRNRLVPK